jgi:hypothetical protein
MLVPSRLACGQWLAGSLLRIRYGFPQRSLCNFMSGSQGTTTAREILLV